MASAKKLLAELGCRVADYKRQAEYFDGRALVDQELGSNEYRLVEMLELVPQIKETKFSLDALETLSTEVKAGYSATFEEFNESYHDVIGPLKLWVSQAKARVNGAEGERHKATKIQFPIMSLPEFDGSLEKWMHFRDSFESMVHTSKDLSVMQKYHYLRSSMKLQAGQANVLMDFPLGAEFYEKAWQAVKERYDDSRQLKAQLFNTLFTTKKMTVESSQELRRIIDSFSSSITALNQLKTTWDDMLVHVVQFRLDDQTLKDWQKHLGEDVPTWEMLKAFLTSQWKNLQQLPQQKKAAFKQNEVKASKASKAMVVAEASPQASASSGKKQLSCLMCNESHMLYQCQKFGAMTTRDRQNFVKEKSLCFICFSPTHSSNQCRNSRRCRTCNGTHNTLIHVDRAGSTQSSSEAVMKSEGLNQPGSSHLSPASKPFKPFEQQRGGTSHVASYAGHARMQTLLSTVKLDVVDATGSVQEVRALLDNGSDTNFITTSMATKLGLKLKNVLMPLTGINERTTMVRHSTVATIVSQYGNFEQEIQCSVMSTLTGNLPSRSIDTKYLSIPTEYTLADRDFNKPSKVDMLLGADVFYEALLGEKFRLADGPMMIHTKFGWVLGGSFDMSPSTSTLLSCFNQSCFTAFEDIDARLEKFLELESYGTKSKVYSREEEYCEKLYKNTTKRDATGRYFVELPTKTNIGQLGSNLSNAYRQFYHQEKVRQKDPELNEMYCDYMRNYIETGHMQEVDANNLDDGHYLPHHGVKKITSTTTKLRPVFNASSKSASGLTLNDCLCVGPTVQPELFDILLRFREKPFVLKSDIEKMYRQVFIEPSNRKYQKILWRENSVTEPIRHYQLNTVTFGVSSAPFLATRTLNQIASDNEQKFPEVANAIRDSFYVDDLILGVQSIEQGLELRNSMIEVLSSSQMPTRKWASNEDELLVGLPEGDVEEVKEESSAIKTLGINWFPKTDQLSCNFKLPKDEIITKSTVLSEIASIYDPIGLVGPVVLRAKLFMKSLWEQKIDWKQELPLTINHDWDQFRQRLESLSSVYVNRQAVMTNYVTVELHGFCDASEQAYGAAVYLRSIDSIGNIQVSLICSKSRVSPTKQKSIARLELCSATLLSKLVSRILSVLSTPINEVYLWSDSMITLCWIRSMPSKLSTFIGNRVSVIQEHTEKFIWKHIRSEDNPADVISRGMMPQDIGECELWWKGPAFFLQHQSQWPDSLITIDQDEAVYQNELRKSFVVVKPDSLFEYIETRHSRVKIVINVFAAIRRFAFNCRNKLNKKTGKFNSDETHQATMDIVKIIQRSSFPQESRFFLEKENDVTIKDALIRKSDLKSLAPFMDKEGIIRVGGRLQASKLSYNAKHQIILPNGHFAKILVSYLHKHHLHPGPLALKAIVREEYWPLRLSSMIRKITFECMTCYRVKPKDITQFMGSLPEARVASTSPFTSVAVDYTGAFNIKAGLTRKVTTVKAYIAMFKCMSTGAIHLELVTSLTTSAFIMTFDRFVSRRGLCAEIFSDNATYFEGADNEFKRLMKLIEPEIAEHCESLSIKWRFSPPRAPHYGGIYESGIKTIKHHVKRVLLGHNFTFEEFTTILCKIEAVVNSRPLTPMSEDPNDLQILTPGHFLIGKSFVAKPERNYVNIPQNRLVRWELLQQIQQKFWYDWSHDYLHNLQERPVNFREESNFLLDDLVLVKDTNTPPMKWLRGRIVKLFPSKKDGVVRVVNVRTISGLLNRHVKYLCLLPIERDLIIAGESVR